MRLVEHLDQLLRAERGFVARWALRRLAGPEKLARAGHRCILRKSGEPSRTRTCDPLVKRAFEAITTIGGFYDYLLIFNRLQPPRSPTDTNHLALFPGNHVTNLPQKSCCDPLHGLKQRAHPAQQGRLFDQAPAAKRKLITSHATFEIHNGF